MSPDSALGPGKIALLEHIEATGSLSQAARELGMSYRRAWLLLDDVNRMFTDPATTASVGGSGGGGARLTDLGREIVKAYREIEDAAEKAAERAHRMARQLPAQGGPARRNGSAAHDTFGAQVACCAQVASSRCSARSASRRRSVPSRAGYRPPRTLDGHPSFEGNWTNATITSLQRPARYTSLVIPPGEVAAQTAAHPQVVRQRTDDELDESKPLNGSDLKGGRGYNAFWIDPGTKFARVKGEYRTSWIVDPADGQIPYRDRRARANGRGARELRRAGSAAARRALHREQQQRRSADAELSLQQQLRVRADRRRAGDSRGDEQLRARRAHRRPSSAGGGSHAARRFGRVTGTAKRS